MSAYRFCRTDDISLLVEALRRCWWPHFPHEPEPTVASFKRDIRDLQVWCSSCMVAFDGAEPIGVLIGAKRADATLAYRLAVHPDHVRRGHGRHLVTSLLSKLAILGPPRIVAEVPEALSAMRALLCACGFVEEAVLTDYVSDGDAVSSVGRSAATSDNGSASLPGGRERMTIPLTVGDLEANGLLARTPILVWEQCRETLYARREELRGLAVVEADHIAAYALWRADTGDGARAGTELAALRAVTATDQGCELLAGLLARLRLYCAAPVWFRGVHSQDELPSCLTAHGFRAHARVGLFARAASAIPS